MARRDTLHAQVLGRVARKLEDLGFTKREEEGLRLKQLQRDPKTGRFSWYSTVGEPPKPPPAASVFPPSAKLP